MRVRITSHMRSYQKLAPLYDGELESHYVEIGEGDSAILIVVGPRPGTITVRARDRRLVVSPDASNVIQVGTEER